MFSFYDFFFISEFYSEIKILYYYILLVQLPGANLFILTLKITSSISMMIANVESYLSWVLFANFIFRQTQMTSDILSTLNLIFSQAVIVLVTFGHDTSLLLINNESCVRHT